ncbi:hypothetical protein AK812_SmicGene19518 [Symbiodinium microadriaticum]|uniref:EF-hand domain-containing protein n=1 Tax=Symbiodinium microadriaticum TaxID=2951 RepID=A0A1Q9DSB6_SYMMI|nr:hypothetical protein AK812_SmicGene19518 [Symbiodinium microadriaticum]
MRNVVTGALASQMCVFCTTAIESAQSDKDIAIMKQMHKQRSLVEALKNTFSEIDHDNSNRAVSLDELKQVVEMHILDNIASSRPAADFQPFWKTGTGQEMMQVVEMHILDNIASSRPAADFQPFWKTGTGQEMMQDVMTLFLIIDHDESGWIDLEEPHAEHRNIGTI